MDYSIKNSQSAKGISIKITSAGKVVVTKPWFIPEFVAKQFVQQKEDWILEKLSHFNLSTNPDAIWYKGQNFTFNFLSGKASIVWQYPTLTISAYSLSAAKRLLGQTLRDEAREIIETKVAHWSKIMKLPYKSIRFKDTQSRWGSCSSKQNLNFSWRLIMAPPEVLEYVVIHELSHLRHMDHSNSFWLLVERYDPNYRENRRWLWRHQGELLSTSL